MLNDYAFLRCSLSSNDFKSVQNDAMFTTVDFYVNTFEHIIGTPLLA